jgi:hypothetical protein
VLTSLRCVRGTIQKKITSEIAFKAYTVRPSKEEPQYLIQSNKTPHLAVHKGSALRRLRAAAGRKKHPSRASGDAMLAMLRMNISNALQRRRVKL